MSPEELDGIKAIARLLPESQTRNHIFLLLANIDAQAAQIEALKEKLIAERMKFSEDWEELCFDDLCDCPDLKNIKECHGCKLYERARQQLAEEMKEVDWE